MSSAVDPYDFTASLIGEDTRKSVVKFWQVFTAKAGEIGEMFSFPDGGQDQILEIMQALEPVSMDLNWEFGPSDRGHKLCITAEFRDELRPLARLVMHMAPELPQWRFVDVRDPLLAEQLADVHQGRFGTPITLGKIEASIGRNGRIDQVGDGVGSKDDLNYQILNISTLLLGEELERDWIGFVDATPEKADGLFGILGRNKAAPFDALAWLEMMQGLMNEARDNMPDETLSQVDFDTRPVVLSTTLNLPPNFRRGELVTFYAASEMYMQGVLDGSRFSSRCHSKFDEWFIYLSIPRTKDMPFGHVEDRAQIEERLHHLLSTEGLGGVVAAGHGKDNVYIDFGVRDVQLAVERIRSDLREEDFATRASLHFLDQGLADVVIPIHPDDKNRR